MTDRRVGSLGANVDLQATPDRRVGAFGINIDVVAPLPTFTFTVTASQSTTVGLQATYVPGSIVYPITRTCSQPTTLALRRNISLTRSVLQAHLVGLVGGAARVVALTQATQVALTQRRAVSLVRSLSQAQTVTLSTLKVYQRTVTTSQATAVALRRTLAITRGVTVGVAVGINRGVVRTLAAVQPTQVRLVRQARLTRTLSQAQTVSLSVVRALIQRTVSVTQGQSLGLGRAITLTRSTSQGQAIVLPRTFGLVHTVAQPTSLALGQALQQFVRGVTVGSSVSLDALDVTPHHEVTVSLTVTQSVSLSMADTGQPARGFVVLGRDGEFVIPGRRNDGFVVARRGVRFTVEAR